MDVRRKAGISPQTIHHEMQTLSRAFALQGLQTPTKDPRIIYPKVPDRDPGLELPWTHLLTALPKIKWGPDRSLVVFVAGTGIRRAELARMRKVDLNVEQGRIIVAVGKTRPRELPMPQAALPTVKVLLEMFPDTPWILDGPDEHLRVKRLEWIIRRAKKDAGDPRLCLHELRRVFGSRLAELGVRLEIVEALLGHKLTGVTGLYVRAAPQPKRDAMDLMWAGFPQG